MTNALTTKVCMTVHKPEDFSGEPSHWRWFEVRRCFGIPKITGCWLQALTAYMSQADGHAIGLNKYRACRSRFFELHSIACLKSERGSR